MSVLSKEHDDIYISGFNAGMRKGIDRAMFVMKTHMDYFPDVAPLLTGPALPMDADIRIRQDVHAFAAKVLENQQLRKRIM